MSRPLDRTARRIAKAHRKPEAVKQRKNGAEELRTYFLNRLHRSVGVCMTCGKVSCPEKTSGSTLPSEMSQAEVLAALNDAAQDCGLERL